MKKDFKDRHHLVPKSRHRELKLHYSKDDIHRTLVMWRHKHTAWHAIWRDKTIDEVIQILIRVRKIIKKKGGKK